MQTEVIEVGKFRKTKDSFGTQPFCIAFVYSKFGNFVVKGMSREVETYIAQKFPFCFYKYTFWKNGESRGGWKTPNGLALYFSPKKIKNRTRFVVSMNTTNGWQSDILTFRNMPKKWLPIFDSAIYRKG